MWDLAAATLLDPLNVKGITHDLLTPTRVQNPHSVAASCRCIFLLQGIPNPNELEMQ